jgi:cyclic beta-1,2-glucan synthetase
LATRTPPSSRSRLLKRLLRAGQDRTDQRLIGPIRGELFGPERLAAHARSLAQRQVLLPRDLRRDLGPLLRRLHETRAILEQTRAELSESAHAGLDISPAGEWLLDNYYIVEEHIRGIRTNLPAHYYRELPKLATGVLAGYPRVYEIAIELIAHSEGHLSLENIELVVREFQRGASLSMGELWAIPSMLRLGLVENIRRMALRTSQRLAEIRSCIRSGRTKPTSRRCSGSRSGSRRTRCRSATRCRVRISAPR